MQSPSAHIEGLFQEARAYHEQGDVYNAVKLCKRIIKSVPEWCPPYAMLGDIYKYRQEWKAALHYNKKTVALEVADRSAWWNIGIAATALKKPRLARRVWNKFGLDDQRKPLPKMKSVRIAFGKQFDIIWAKPIDPVQAVISSIPAPATQRRFRDTILLDGVIAGYTIANGKRYPVYEELGIQKQSNFRTFSCQIHLQDADDLMYLEKLCLEAGFGFENWSNAAWVFANQPGQSLPEYYGADFLSDKNDFPERLHIAIAAPQRQEVEEILRSWQVITLGYFSNLTCHL